MILTRIVPIVSTVKPFPSFATDTDDCNTARKSDDPTQRLVDHQFDEQQPALAENSQRGEKAERGKKCGTWYLQTPV
jgi:hypothetical protein